MLEQVYQDGDFVVVKAKNCFIVINTNKNFKNGHSHLKSLWACKKVIYCAKYRTVNGDMNRYMLTSIIRISEDDEYISKIEDLITVRNRKGKKNKYYNTRR